MQEQSPALQWALTERRRLAEEISNLSARGDLTAQSAELPYLKERLKKIDGLISELERSQD